MKQKIGEYGVAVYGGQLQKAVNSPDILKFSMKRRIFLILLTMYNVTFPELEAFCSWYTMKQ